jgi:anti-sigma28 factor (negative regulator of flagellin synthesis)
MKVELNSAASAQLPVESAVKPAASSNVVESAQSADRTTLRSNQTVQSLVNRALQSPEIRESTVQALRQSVNNGTYQADASKTASAIANHGS